MEREREKKIKIDSQKMSKFWLVLMREKIWLFNFIWLVRRYALFVAYSFWAIHMLISWKLVQRRRIGEKRFFFWLLAGRHQRVKAAACFKKGLNFSEIMTSYDQQAPRQR